MMSLTRLPEGCIWGSGSLSICVSAEPQNSPLPATSMMHSRSFYFEICTTLCRPQLLKTVLPENVTLQYNLSHFFHSSVLCLLARAMTSLSSHLAQAVSWERSSCVDEAASELSHLPWDADKPKDQAALFQEIQAAPVMIPSSTYSLCILS